MKLLTYTFLFITVLSSLGISLCTSLSLHEAIESGNIKQVRNALAAGTDVNAKDNSLNSPWLNMTPIMLAVRHGYRDIVKVLLESGAKVGTDSNWDELTKAARFGYYDIAQLLLGAGAKVNVNNNDALIAAAYMGYTNIVKLLIEHGAYIKARDVFGRSALDYAIKNANWETTEYLEKILKEREQTLGAFDKVKELSVSLFYQIKGFFYRLF